MSDEIVDIAGAAVADAPAADSTAEVSTPEVDETVGSEGAQDSAEEGAESSEGKESATHNADGSEKTPEQQKAFKEASDKAAPLPQDVRSALKQLRDSNPDDPKVQKVVRELHGAYERFNAYKAEFPTVAAAKEAATFIKEIGGTEGFSNLKAQADAVAQSDELLYNGDPQLWTNVIEDLKASGHEDALGKLAGSFASALREHDPEAFLEELSAPIVMDSLKQIGYDRALDSLLDALQAGDVKKALEIRNVMTSHYLQMKEKYGDKAREDKAISKERQSLLSEKKSAEETKQKAYEEGVATDCEKGNNNLLGKALGPFLKLPYFKSFPRETLVDLGNGIKDRLYTALKADKAYQAQMSTFWKSKSQDRTKIVAYHNQKVQSLADSIVRSAVQARYPNYAKGGTAAGKAAAAADKKTLDSKLSQQSVTSGKPVYVASRPTNLIREDITVNGKTYSSSDLVTMQITGKGFVKTPDGKGYRLVTWRK